MSFAKLFSSITESSLWSESKTTRLLFVTMLAKADASGYVEAAIPGLARIANLTLEETTEAIQVLENPDPHSKDLDEHPENEGRRIVKVKGGWVLINYEEYRARRGEDERREYMREYMREYRAKSKKSVNNRKQSKPDVNRGKPQLAQAEAEVEAEAEAEATVSSPTTSGIDRSGSTRSDEPTNVVKIDPCCHYRATWNEITGGVLPPCQKLTRARRTRLQAKMKEDPNFAENWVKALQNLITSPHHIGQNERGWKATFDFMLQTKEDRVVQMLEFDGAVNQKPPGGRAIADWSKQKSGRMN